MLEFLLLVCCTLVTGWMPFQFRISDLQTSTRRWRSLHLGWGWACHCFPSSAARLYFVSWTLSACKSWNRRCHLLHAEQINFIYYDFDEMWLRKRRESIVTFRFEIHYKGSMVYVGLFSHDIPSQQDVKLHSIVILALIFFFQLMMCRTSSQNCLRASKIIYTKSKIMVRFVACNIDNGEICCMQYIMVRFVACNIIFSKYKSDLLQFIFVSFVP